MVVHGGARLWCSFLLFWLRVLLLLLFFKVLSISKFIQSLSKNIQSEAVIEIIEPLDMACLFLHRNPAPACIHPFPMRVPDHRKQIMCEFIPDSKYQLVDDVLHRAVKRDVVKGVRLVDHHLQEQRDFNIVKITLQSGKKVNS